MDNNVNGDLRSTSAGRIRKRAWTFRSDENGSLIIFGVYIFIIMLGAGGMAVDFMRAERERARLQYTLDRAVLAAAALSNPLNEKDVVEDYFVKAGYDKSVVTTTTGTEAGGNTATQKTVRAVARGGISTFFIKHFGIKDLGSAASGAATEAIQNIEISLVLDVSGSMEAEYSEPENGEEPVLLNDKLGDMQRAARDFVSTLLVGEANKYISINVIPYNMQVNAGNTVLSKLNRRGKHEDSHCIDFDSADFETTRIEPNSPLNQTAHYVGFQSFSDHPNFSSDDGQERRFDCPFDPASEVLLMSNNVADIHAKINGLSAGGATSIDTGVKWGTFFLDPTSNAIMSNFTKLEQTKQFAGRPAAFQDPDKGRPDTLKILVVLTDGENTYQNRLKSQYASGPSNVWMDETSGSDKFSIRNTDGVTGLAYYYDNNGYIRSRNMSFNYFHTGILPENTEATYNSRNFLTIDGPYVAKPEDFSYNIYNSGSSRRLDWSELWKMMSVRYYSKYMIFRQDRNSARSNGYHNYYTGLYNQTQVRSKMMTDIGPIEKNKRLQDVCSAAKNNHIAIYSIGFEVSERSATVMKNCASEEVNFYRVDDEKRSIDDAFNSIANTIQRLKLVN